MGRVVRPFVVGVGRPAPGGDRGAEDNRAMDYLTDWPAIERKALELRQRGLSYEELADQLPREIEIPYGDELGLTPSEAYELCHPEKSREQLKRWAVKHSGRWRHVSA
jgi:hypothetical protein